MQYRAYPSVGFQIQGQDADGDWHLIDKPLGPDGDHLAHLGSVAQMLRDHGIARYSRLRLMKYVTTAEVIGQEVDI